MTEVPLFLATFAFMKHRIIIFCLLALCCLGAAARGDVDSLRLKEEVPQPPVRIVTGASALAAGIVARSAAPTVMEISGALKDRKSTPVADVAQYLPLAFPWAMKAFGAPTRSGWGRMAVSHAFGAFIMAGATEALKRSVMSRRPDGSDWRSFPSGHTAWAFLGATATAIELGDRSPWYAVGAYAFATGVAVSRVIDGRHFPADVAAGAGVGIISAQLGNWLGDAVFGRRQLNPMSGGFDCDDDSRLSLSLVSGLRYELGRQRVGDRRFSVTPALTAALSLGWRLHPHFGVGVEASMSSAYLVGDEVLTARLNTLGVSVSGSYILRFARLWRWDCGVSAGLRHNLGLRHAPADLEVGGLSPEGRVETGLSIRLHGRLGCRASLGYELSSRKLRAGDLEKRSTVQSLTAALCATVAF